MTITIFTDSFYPQINGVVTSITDIAIGMANKGHEVIIVAPAYKEDIPEFNYKNITVYRLPAIDASFYEGFKWSAIMHKPTFKKIKEANIDVVHFMTPLTVSIFGILCGKLLKKPIIGTYHTFISEITYLRQLFPKAGPFTQKFAWRYSNAFYNRANLITIPTENAKQELIKNRCKPPIQVVSNGIKLDSFDNSKASEIKNKYNPNGEIILYVGRVAPEKNMICLLDAFLLLTKEDTTTKLLVVGDGPSLKDCRLFASKNNIDDRIIFLGLVSNSELKKSGIFGACRMFATASKTETQSITILEAQANGIPAIGPNAKGIPNVITHDYNGFIVEPDNSEQLKESMKLLLENEDLYRAFSERSIENAMENDFNKILNDWEVRYKKIIN